MMLNTTTTQKRKYARQKVNMDAMASFDGGVVSGEILDLSVGGVFVETLGGILDGYAKGADTILEGVKVGDVATIEMGKAKMLVEICWKGWHEGHQCPGFGARFATGRN